MPDPGIREILDRGLAQLSIPQSKELRSAFMSLLSELKKWSSAYNLTSLKKDEDIIIKHFLDSLLYLKVMPEGDIRVADIGSGAGFPGIPLKIVRPEIEMYLVEPTQKKTAFLRHIVRKLDLKETEVIEKRIEAVSVGVQLSSPVDMAVSRALFDVRELANKASHILKPGGTLVLNKGPKVKEELKSLGDVRYEMLDVSLPLTGITRHLIVVYPDR